MPHHFTHYIKTLTQLPPEQEEAFSALITIKPVKKDENFIRAGQLPKTIAFVTKGLFRYYYTSEEGVEFTKGFFVENTVLSSYSAILENRASYFGIQALEDAVIEVVNYEAFRLLFPQHPCWNEFLLALLQKGYLKKEEREREFLLFDAEQRYRTFLQNYPNLENRIKQHLIASYLGITPESLSRIRKKMRLLS
ncbi:Crp/Fnr family transcriptional regulator [Rapidithrix thailandica]|uniref:Crp/Fnr family transcriptional regulator n=1 Tax=Rapidithrix thailandica TaxID=413964 RepID=A0AAW9SDJ7_9BACT